MRIWSWNPIMLLVEMQNSTPTSEKLSFRIAPYILWKYVCLCVYVWICVCCFWKIILFFAAPVNKTDVFERPQGPGAQVEGYPVGKEEPYLTSFVGPRLLVWLHFLWQLTAWGCSKHNTVSRPSSFSCISGWAGRGKAWWCHSAGQVPL